MERPELAAAPSTICEESTPSSWASNEALIDGKTSSVESGLLSLAAMLCETMNVIEVALLSSRRRPLAVVAERAVQPPRGQLAAVTSASLTASIDTPEG